MAAGQALSLPYDTQEDRPPAVELRGAELWSASPSRLLLAAGRPSSLGPTEPPAAALPLSASLPRPGAAVPFCAPLLA